MVALRSPISGEAGGGAAAAAGASPGPGSGVKAAFGPPGAPAAGELSFSTGDGAGHSYPNPIEFFFYHQLIFVPLIFFPFPSVIKTWSKEEGLELTLAMRQ